MNYSNSTPQITAVRYIKAPQYTQGICFQKSGSSINFGVSLSWGRENTSSTNNYVCKERWR